jgi:hypothetical protein
MELMNPIKVEIGQFREVDKGSLKAFFSIVIYPEGQKILDCRYFIQGDKRWFSFPQKEIKYTDGRKTEYIPYVSYLNKEYLENLKASVLNALKDAKPQEKYGQTKSPTAQNTQNSVPSDTSANWF